MNRVAILGSTGSIGVSTLEVMALHPDRYRPWMLSANRNVERLAAQIARFEPDHAVICDETAFDSLKAALAARGYRGKTRLHAGLQSAEALVVASEVDTLVAAIVGAAGLRPTLAAVRSGKRILLANKEVLVCAGGLFMQALKQAEAVLLPLDSEHNAIFQCWPDAMQPQNAGIRQIWLTASGGPFRGLKPDALAAVTPDQACKHPNWSMGRKISVDSATMMNKGLELIEACWLFDLRPEQIEVLVHPQSIVHSLVEYLDGSQLAQLSSPDMRTPIAHALAWPNRIDSGVKRLDLKQLHQLTFEGVDEGVFRCLGLARQAFEQGGSAALVLNAANEVAVDAFLQQRIGFLQIAEVVEKSLEYGSDREPEALEQVIELDRMARDRASRYIDRLN